MAAVAGGAIVGMPLLYTMEMWRHGMTVSPWHLLALLLAILMVNFIFSIMSGFRHDSSLIEAAMEAVTSVGIGLVFSAMILWLIGELTRNIALSEIVGKILLEATAVSIGVSFANAQVRDRSRSGDENEGDDQPQSDKSHSQQPEDPERLQLHADLVDAGAALAGSTLFALNIAPTEEVMLIASRLSPLHLLALFAATVLLCYVILFASGFEEHRVHVPGIFQNPWAETLMTCAISLLVAFGLLLLLGGPASMSHLPTAAAAVVVLGLPATVGGAAGRLIA